MLHSGRKMIASKTYLAGLREEEIGNGQNEETVAVHCQSQISAQGILSGLHDGEDGVGIVPNVVEGDRRYHDDHEVEDPVSRCCKCVGRGTNAEWDNLGRVQPDRFLVSKTGSVKQVLSPRKGVLTKSFPTTQERKTCKLLTQH